MRRSDPVYNAHAYLTKVPYTAIVPFIEALTERGEVVLDVFAGSGMTGVAAVMTGRNAELRDISVLGRHIGDGYLTPVDADAFEAAAKEVMACTRTCIGDVYAVRCAGCEDVGTLSKTVWSYRYACETCERPITYFESFRNASWDKRKMRCPHCGVGFRLRGARRIDEVPVVDQIRCDCTPKLRDQEHSVPLVPASLDGRAYPDVEIGDARQMFHASALAKHGLHTTAAFFSARNLAVLAALHESIGKVANDAIHKKLMFAFTAILTRASKRYQWHPKRPLNAANQNYYIAPVFYEWNVFELFERKVKAAARSDACIDAELRARGVGHRPRSTYRLGSADTLDLPDQSVAYVFTDPPFGSQIFYSDMNLFQEAWLGSLTDQAQEAVIDRSRTRASHRSVERYEELIIGALKECHRVLRNGGWLSMVFSNSNGEMWTLVQRAILAAGFSLEHVTLLDKGQRSVKGLTSGLESVVTADLILTMRKASAPVAVILDDPPEDAFEEALTRALLQPGELTPTRIYLWVVTKFLRNGWTVDGIAVRRIRDALVERGFALEPATGVLARGAPVAA